jgi:hypothetical protein
LAPVWQWRGEQRRRELPGLTAHSLIPIVIGYVFAHYLSNLVEHGQQTIILLADLLDRGWNLLGLGDADVAYVLSLHPSVLATLKVGFVVAGQVALMVGYTFTGRYLLVGG